MSESERRNRQWVLRPMLILAALAALAVVLIPAGSAATNTKPFAAVFGSTVGANGAVAFAITDEARNQALGSSNVYAPAGVTITGTDAPASKLDPTQSFPTTTLKLRNLNLSTNGTFSTTIYVSATSCGSFQWGIDAHQSNDYNSLPGNTLSLDAANSRLTTLATGGCHLAWIYQPASAQQSTPITDTPFTSSGTNVHKVTVAVEDSTNTVVTSLNTGTASLAVTGSFDDCAPCNPTFSNTTSGTFQNGVATFPNFQSGFTGTGFSATASALGLQTPASSPTFIIEPNGVDCIGLDPCPLSGPAGNGQVNVNGNGGNFQYIALGAAHLPDSVTGPNGGCANFKGTGTSFQETDARNGDGTLDVTLSIKNKDLKNAYGPNYGQPNVPICIGVKYLVSNTPVNCDPLTQVAWADRLIDPVSHTLGGYGSAVCDTQNDSGHGYWFGAAGNFQDPNPPYDSNSVPLITGWGSSPDGVYRTFTMRVPAAFDMQGHG